MILKILFVRKKNRMEPGEELKTTIPLKRIMAVFLLKIMKKKIHSLIQGMISLRIQAAILIIIW